ncbi:MAG TPA: excinuclease ABC subunit A [Flavobacteriales bacterium]|nr:excinuclease ABC subunit A [Flavobacteriales bacterium]
MEITIRGARMHNLKNIDVRIPKKKLTVITGLSGSGKSSLAFDTLYAEGQRRYVESLSSYARQFLGRLDKPDVDSIHGLSPAIAIEQKTSTGGPRSTVGTRTEVHDYFRMLYARVGKTYSPISGEEVKRDKPEDVLEKILSKKPDSRFMIVAPLIDKENRNTTKQLQLLLEQGFSRILVNSKATLIDELIAVKTEKELQDNKLQIVIDRMTVSNAGEESSRILDSLETAFFEGNGNCSVVFDDEEVEFNNRFERDGVIFHEPSPDLFSFNSPVGACPTCEGYGSTLGIDPDKVIPDSSLSIYNDAIAPWRSDRMKKWKTNLIMGAAEEDVNIHAPWHELSEVEKEKVWSGTKNFKGLNQFFGYVEKKGYKIQYRVMLSRYRGRTSCPECKGARIRKETSYVIVAGITLSEILVWPIDKVLEHIQSLELGKNDSIIAKRIICEINERLVCLIDLGLGYLTLLRGSSTLSGGESQRISLSTCLGSALVGSTYVLDEPSIGLHPQDTHRLISVLYGLRDKGNTVVVVEHDDDIMAAADNLIDMGPQAGSFGGEVVFSGNHAKLKKLPANHKSLTAAYLTGRLEIATPKVRRKSNDEIVIKGARANNLQGFNAVFPLRCLVAVTGVSGSGKSTLVSELLVPAVKAEISDFPPFSNGLDGIEGNSGTISSIEFIDQNPIGKSSRSCPVTYVKAFDEIRSLLSGTTQAKARGLKPSHFSFNVAGGRCETCEGEGVITVGMQFMADLKLKCENCRGKRYTDEILEITWRGKNIHEILSMTVEDALLFFAPIEDKSASTKEKRLITKLQPLFDVGLGYITLGQGSNTLSGGEAGRIKLATFLSRGDKQGHTLFVFDEPTTGLHVHDVAKLLESFERLINKGHSIIVVEHQLDVINTADFVLDLGPGGGEDGGELIFSGTPEDMVKCKRSITGKHLGKKTAL